MNERIKVLAKKSGVWFVTPREDLLEDFAELIVRDCVSMAKGFELAIEENGINPYRYGLSKAMQEHFGVKE